MTRSTATKYWLMKSEPTVYSIDDLARDGKTRWDGVRNFQARNYMTAMKPGDLALFYHSNADPPGVAGVMRASAVAAPDETQFDAADGHHEKRATREQPVWFSVEVTFVAKAPRLIALDELRAQKKLAKMELLRRGSRLSITPVTPAQFALIRTLAGIAEGG